MLKVISVFFHIDVIIIFASHRRYALGFKPFLLYQRTAHAEMRCQTPLAVHYTVAGQRDRVAVEMQNVSYRPHSARAACCSRDRRIRCNTSRGDGRNGGSYSVGKRPTFCRALFHAGHVVSQAAPAIRRRKCPTTYASRRAARVQRYRPSHRRECRSA